MIAIGELISDSKIRQLWSPELVQKTGIFFKHFGLKTLREWIDIMFLRLYGRLATIESKKLSQKANIYHYRAGFGGESVKVAKNLGMKTLCAHSIVHPLMMNYLIEKGGRLPLKVPRFQLIVFGKKY